MKIIIQIWNLIVACFLSFCFPASFIFSLYANNGFAEKKETPPSIRESFVNLNESIGHNGQEEAPVVIKDEPIRPNLRSEQKQGNRAMSAKTNRKLKAIASAYYAPVPNQSWYFTGSYAKEKKLNGEGKVTSSGKIPEKRHTVAAHPKFLPIGANVRIKGIEELEGVIFEVEDGGKLIVGNKIDIFMGKGESALREAIKLGKKPVIIEVL